MNRDEFLVSDTANLQETPLLYYVGGYKYQSRNDMVYRTLVLPPADIVTDLVILRRDGWLWVSKYFAWDGCSGPTLDDATNMRAGQAHDALYTLMRMGLLPGSFRLPADDVLHQLMLRDGAYPFRANYYMWAVNHFAAGNARTSAAKKVLVAPRQIVLPGLAPA